jgi:DNA-binding XRE family transcriptional regulator
MSTANANKEFGIAMRAARMACGLTQANLARRVGQGNTAIFRWEKGSLLPKLETRIRVVRALGSAPRPMLERLANAGDVSLAMLGLVPAEAQAAPGSSDSSGSLGASAQALVDDALREAAEEADVSPKLLRPALSRMLDRLARARVPMDAAARMVLGVPKKEAKDAKAPAPKPA